jgi:YbbR domain-containing protein
VSEQPLTSVLDRLRVPRQVVLRMVISLAVALVLWGLVTTQQDPPMARTFNNLPIQSMNMPENLVIPVELGTASIRVEGPTSLVAGITAESLSPHVNLSGVGEPGTYIVPVEVTAPGAVEREITPSQLSIIVDTSDSRAFTLEWEVEPIEDNTRLIGEIIPEVSEVTVTGPESIVERVSRVIIPIDIGERTESFTGDFDTIAVDENGVQIPEVAVRPRRVSASVEVEARGRLVPVLVPIAGSPAEGYDVADRVVSPPAVVLTGPDDVLADLVSVSTEPVDIEGAFEAVTRRVPLTGLPPGVSVVDPRDGTVLVVIQFQQRGTNQTLQDQPVLIGDVPPGYEVTVEPPAIDVVIFGGEEALVGLRQGDVAPRVSIQGLEPGTYDLRPSVLVPPDVRWIRTEPATVRVTIRSTASTPAAAATPRPSRALDGTPVPTDE